MDVEVKSTLTNEMMLPRILAYNKSGNGEVEVVTVQSQQFGGTRSTVLNVPRTMLRLVNTSYGEG